MNLSIIVAFDQNQLIGAENSMPWHIPEDLAFFRKQTLGHNVIMGKNTWLSLGKPLDERTNIILTNDHDMNLPGVLICNSIQEVLDFIGESPAYVIGGASIFRQFLPLVNLMYITRIKAVFKGDTYFPQVDWTKWELRYFESLQSTSGFEISLNQYVRG